MTTWQITVRHGARGGRYHTFAVEADDAGAALARAAEALPAGVGASADLVELRVAVDPEDRPPTRGAPPPAT